MEEGLDEGYRWQPRLGERAASAWREAEEHRREGKILELLVEGFNRGGLLVRPWGLPPGLRDEDRLEALSRWMGRSLRLQVVEVDARGRRLVLSPQTSEDVRHASRLWRELAPGHRRRGVVTRRSELGAFVDVGAIEGLIHISELSWGRMARPDQVLSPGQELEAQLLQVDPRRRRLALSLRQAAF